MVKKQDPRAALDELIAKAGSDYLAVSKMIGRNAAYIQQYIKRGVPRRLPENDRRIIARFLGVDEQVLGGPPPPEGPGSAFAPVRRFDVAASAGHGALVDGELALDAIGFGKQWLRDLGCKAEDLSLISVTGDSMEPRLRSGDDILVDRRAAKAPLRDGVHVIRLNDSVMVKRLRKTGKTLSVISDNERYPPIENVDPARVDIIGRVVWSGGKLD